MKQLIKKLYEKKTLLLLVLCGLIMFDKFLDFIYCCFHGSTSSIFSSVLNMITYGIYFGLIAYGLLSEKRKLYSVLIGLFFAYTIYGNTTRVISTLTSISSSGNVLYTFKSIFAVFNNFALGILSIAIIIELITNKERDNLRDYLFVICLAIEFLYFIFSIAYAIRYHNSYVWQDWICFFTNLGISSIECFCLATKVFMFKDPKPEEDKNDDIFADYSQENEEQEDAIEEQDVLQENGIPQK